nr:MAG TPA: hypothetical protein [Caudoviricetes sp.]
MKNDWDAMKDSYFLNKNASYHRWIISKETAEEIKDRGYLHLDGKLFMYRDGKYYIETKSNKLFPVKVEGTKVKLSDNLQHEINNLARCVNLAKRRKEKNEIK